MSLPADVVRELAKRPRLIEALVAWLRDLFAGRNAERSLKRLAMIAAGKEAIRAPYRRARK